MNLPAQFDVGDLPQNKELWVEATAVSAGLRDIVLQWEYKGLKDKVKATAAWVNKTNRPAGQGSNPWCTRQAADGWPHNPKPGAGGQVPELDKVALANLINNTRIAANNSRYGHGPHEAVGGADTWFAGRILWEFELKPHGVEGLGVKVDITRQLAGRKYDFPIGSGTPLLDKQYSRDFPWLGSDIPEGVRPPQDNERPNDDAGSADEDNDPTNHRIYSWDAPATPIDAPPAIGFLVWRATLKEWVRAKLENGTFTTSQSGPQGTRASEKYDWHCVFYLNRESTGKWTEDNNNPSACAPKLTVGAPADKGTLTVTVNQGNAVTEGWSVTYDANDDEWDVLGSDGSSGTLTKQGDGSWQGNGSKGGNVRVTLKVEHTAGKDPFVNADQFKFTTFKSTASSGKVNETKTGEFPKVGEGP